MSVDLRVGGPSTIVSEPVSHVFVFDDVVKVVFYLLVFQDAEHGFGKAALGVLGGPLDEDYDWGLVEDTFDFRMPDLFLLLEG